MTLANDLVVMPDALCQLLILSPHALWCGNDESPAAVSSHLFSKHPQRLAQALWSLINVIKGLLLRFELLGGRNRRVQSCLQLLRERLLTLLLPLVLLLDLLLLDLLLLLLGQHGTVKLHAAKGQNLQKQVKTMVIRACW